MKSRRKTIELQILGNLPLVAKLPITKKFLGNPPPPHHPPYHPQSESLGLKGGEINLNPTNNPK